MLLILVMALVLCSSLMDDITGGARRQLWG